MDAQLKSLRHGKERLYGTLMVVFGGLFWIAIIAFFVLIARNGKGREALIIPVVEIVIIVLFVLVTKLFYRAYLFGHAVLIGPNEFPHLHQAIAAGAKKLGLSAVPQAFLYNSNGLMNAFAMRVLGTRMVLLTSALIDVENDRQVDFVIGHELGHHVAGHLTFWKNVIKFPGNFIPFLGPAYHRARELTADRIGAYCVGDYDAARGGLYMLACGSARLNSLMDADCFAAQEQLVPPITGFLLNVFSGYPRLTRRVNEVDDYFRTQGIGRPIPAAA